MPHVPGIVARPRLSLSPATPVMLIGFELNSVWPRAMLARRLAWSSCSPCAAGFAQALNRSKITGVNGTPCGLAPRGLAPWAFNAPAP